MILKSRRKFQSKSIRRATNLEGSELLAGGFATATPPADYNEVALRRSARGRFRSRSCLKRTLAPLARREYSSASLPVVSLQPDQRPNRACPKFPNCRRRRKESLTLSPTFQPDN